MEELKLPKYYLVKKNLAEKINNEELQIGEMIPSEQELMSMFNVSRITVRRAVTELEQEGYLYKIQGKGTFVKGDQNNQDLISITSCTEDVQRQGMVATRKVLQSHLMPADKKCQRKLGVAEGEEIFHLARIYYADGEPINYTNTYLPHKYFPGITQYDFAEQSLYRVLEKDYQVTITRACRSVEAVLAYDEIAEYLEVPTGIPLLLFQCTTYGVVAGKVVPLETFKCFYRSDRFKFCINQVR